MAIEELKDMERSRNKISKDVEAERKKTEAAEARAKAENERAEEYKKLLIANGIAVPAFPSPH